MLREAARDKNGLVRLEAAIACSYIGSKNAFEALKIVCTLPNDKHLSYAIKTSLGSAPMRKFWNPDALEKNQPLLYAFLNKQKMAEKMAEKSKADSKFDRQKNLLKAKVSCMKERMLYSVELMARPNLGEYKKSSVGDIIVKRNQPIRIEFLNPDATPHKPALRSADALINSTKLILGDRCEAPKPVLLAGEQGICQRLVQLIVDQVLRSPAHSGDMSG